MQRSQLCQRPDRISTAVLNERARDDLERARQCAVWELLLARVILCIFVQEVADGELARATTWDNFALEEDISCDLEEVLMTVKKRYIHLHGILKISLNFHEDVLGGASQDNCAGSVLLAFGNVSEVLLAELFDLKEAGISSEVSFGDLVGS